MKAKIEKTRYGWQWRLLSANGSPVARSYAYSRRDNTRRGLKRFLKMFGRESILNKLLR